jgi:cytochrome c556
MNIFDDNPEAFRTQVHAALYDKVKEALTQKKIEIASSLYTDEEECETCNEQE